MSMNISAWAIRRPLPAVLLFILLCAAGFAGFRALDVSRFPDISLPMVTVTITLPGAAPSRDVDPRHTLPDVGEHTEEVLSGLGLSAAEIAALTGGKAA